MNILITGGAGYIGYSLVQQLLRDCPESTTITVYDNLTRGSYHFFFAGQPQQRVRFVRGELLDARLLAKEVAQADVIFHLAAKVTTPFADHDGHIFEQVNHWGTAGLVTLVEANPVRRFIYLSSTGVYGRSDNPVQEASATHPESFYGVSKARAEDHVKRLTDSGVDTYIIRSGNVYGFNPCIRFDAVINKFVFHAHTQGRITINGSGHQQRAFIHVDKLAFVLSQLTGEAVQPGIYNLAEHNLSINDIADQLKDLYPDLERLHINQHLHMREISIELPVNITSQIIWHDKPFIEELTAFKQAFTIGMPHPPPVNH